MNIRQFIASAALSFVLGSLHSFSVLIEPLERTHQASRGAISLSYSLAIVTLTAGVALSSLLLRHLKGRQLALLVGIGASSGLALASITHSLTGLLIGYGVLFGFCNGVGYAIFLQGAASAMPDQKGLAIGAITALYGLGAMAFSFVLDAWATRSTAEQSLLVQAACVALGGFVCAINLKAIEFAPASRSGLSQYISLRTVAHFWMIYFCGACGGLMIIGHAAGLLREAGSASTAWAPVVVAFGNIFGSLIGGPLADMWAMRASLTWLGLITGIVILTLALWPGGIATLVWLVLAGFSYGALISLIPALLAKSFGPVLGNLMFARVFTAWGAAGLLAPWLAGILFDIEGTYSIAIALAATLAFIGAGLSLLMPTPRLETPKSSR